MDTTNHLVQSGETLSAIAQHYQCDQEQLLLLNPFIKDPNRIQVGWNLTVPVSAGVTPTGQQTAPASATQVPVTTSTTGKLLVLDSPADSTGKEPETFTKTVTAACSPRYASVLYSPEDKAFWLLPQRAADAIDEAAAQLKQAVDPSKAPEARKKGLDAQGLLEHFLEPRLSFFLNGEDQQWMQAFEADNPLSTTAYTQEHGSLLALSPLQLSNQNLLPRMQELEHWQSLRKEAINEAERQGYAYEGDMLFSPQSVAARSAVQDYLKARNALLEQGELPVIPQDEIAKLLQESIQRYEEASDCSINCRATFMTYKLWKEEHQQAFDYSEYVNAIIKVAEYGLALPEFALINDQQAGLASGIQRFKDYLALQKQQREVELRLQSKYKAWITASGENQQAPASLVEAERQEWQTLENQRKDLKQQAETAVASHKVRRHLLWEPEQFTPKPVERLVKTGFPLKEVSVPTTPNLPLQHFSMHVLKGMLKSVVKTSGPSFAGNSDGNSASDRQGNDFRDWLLGLGAVEIKDQGPWFDREGWFDIELFYKQLSQSKGYCIDALKDGATRNEWGERLRQVVFHKDTGFLRLFDVSPQARLVRCLTPLQPSIHAGAKVEGPSFSVHEGVTASAKAHFDIDLARGEVEVLKVDLPERSAAKEIKVRYIDYQGQPRYMNLGKLSVHLGARAWGYAGASMLLAAELELSPGNTGYGATLAPIEDATREDGTASTAGTARSEPQVSGKVSKVQIEDGLKASFNLFAGVQAGVKVSGALNWAPPKAVALLRTAPSVSNNPVLSDGWLSLSRLEADLAGALGAGANGEFTVSLDRGCFIVRVKAALVAGAGAKGSLSFAVGYEAVVDLINLWRRELRENHYHPINWIDSTAFEYLSKLNLLGGVGLDVSMVYMMGLYTADVVANLYEALTQGGKGGQIAHWIMTDKHPKELEQWFIDATPEALGPMLMTLLSEPEAFEVVDSELIDGRVFEKNKRYTEPECHFLQQRAIERILSWILRNAERNGTLNKVQRQFDEACMRMNRFGTKELQAGQAYCTNRLRMDRFMSVPVLKHSTQRTDEIRNLYKEHVMVLGRLRDGFCQRSDYEGATFVPGGHATYTGIGD
ncbi:LysM domain-containing protein [Ectopseudomonas mendocina]|uniref:LysM domain-containing protein n=1 Tax=Ectopseudomonas mendocina TaxID=300 RepID=A0ABZ2RCI4_ECTME